MNAKFMNKIQILLQTEFPKYLIDTEYDSKMYGVFIGIMTKPVFEDGIGNIISMIYTRFFTMEFLEDNIDGINILPNMLRHCYKEDTGETL